MTHEHDDWADGDCTACLNERTVSYWAGFGVLEPNPNVARIPTPDQRTLRRWGIMLGIVKDPSLYQGGTMTPTLTDQDCADIAITAAEGGIGYWSEITGKYDPVSTDDWDHGTRDVYYTLMQTYGVDRRLLDVGADVIRRGVSGLQRGGVLWAFGSYEDMDIDADRADYIVQMGLFGKLVYS